MRGLYVALVAVLVMAGAGCAPPPPDESVPAMADDGVATALREAWQAARLNLEESAEQLAEADYDFRPVEGVRSFGQLLTHVAGANYVFCSAARGEAAPHGEDGFEDVVTSRAEIIETLGASLAYCDTAYDAATDASLAELVDRPFNGGPGPRAHVLMGNIGHLNEHYGNLVTYFRLRGMIPPSSRR